MSKYTAEFVEAEVEVAMTQGKHGTAAMFREFAALLRERESAKAAVTDEMTEAACRAYAIASDNPWPYSKEEWNDDDRAYMRAALKVVAPMLSSARVPEREALEAIKRLPARPFPDPIAHSWEAFGRAVMGAFTDAKFIAIRALAAAPKPETEE